MTGKSTLIPSDLTFNGLSDALDVLLAEAGRKLDEAVTLREEKQRLSARVGYLDIAIDGLMKEAEALSAVAAHLSLKRESLKNDG